MSKGNEGQKTTEDCYSIEAMINAEIDTVDGEARSLYAI